LEVGGSVSGAAIFFREAGAAALAARRGLTAAETMISSYGRGNLMATKKKAAGNEQVAMYERLLATHPEIERKGDANPYTAINGNMFTLLHQSETLAIRLPAEERERFLKKHKTTLFEAYGAVMKEYVRVPDALLANPGELEKYLDMSYEYAKTLKPKPTTKKKR
jgi:TfoX/Sxy family transcriptional regulator of competence genes